RADVGRLDALTTELVGKHAVDPARTPALLPVGSDRGVELFDRPRALVRCEQRAPPLVQNTRLQREDPRAASGGNGGREASPRAAPRRPRRAGSPACREVKERGDDGKVPSCPRKTVLGALCPGCSFVHIA